MSHFRKRFCRISWALVIDFFKTKGKINDNQLKFKYFTYEFKKVTNLDELLLLPKIYKRLSNVSVVRPVLTFNIKLWITKIFGLSLRPVIQKGKLYIKDSGDFINKKKGAGYS